MTMSRSRRDKFEDQLRALQTDINDLSYKLSAPAVSSSSFHDPPPTSSHQLRKAGSKGAVTTNSNTKSTGMKFSGKAFINTSHSSNHGSNVDMKFLRQVQAKEVPDESGAVIESRRNSFLNDASNENKSQGSGDRYTPVYYDMDFNESKVQSNDSFYHSDNDRDRDVKRDKDGDSIRDNEKEKEKEKKKEKEIISPSTGGEYFGETYSLIRERNSLLARLEQSQNEVHELRKAIVENRELQSVYDRLVQDHELVQVSLESSERIRMQQKELINLLQRSAAVTEGPLDLFSCPPLVLTPGVPITESFREGFNWDSSYDGHVSRETLDLDSNSNSRLSMNVLPGYTDFNITNHNQKMINADYNFENYLLSHSSTHDYKSSRMQPTVKKVKTNKVLKTSKSAVPSHLVSTSSAKNRTKAHNQNSSFQNHNNTNQNINSSSSSNHVTVNRATAAHTHSSHTDSKSANVQRTKISNETNTYENTHPHTHKDRDRDRDTHTATNKDRDRIHVRAPGTGTQIPSLTRYDEQVRHSLLTLGLDPGPYTESYSPPVSARAYPGVHAVVRESPRRPRSAPPSASRPPTSTPASPSPPASPHAHAPYLHKTLRSASAEARRPSTLDSRGGIATLGKNERTRREPSAVRNIPKNVLPDRNGSQGQSARKDSYTTLDLYPFSSPGRGRSGRPPVAPHPSLSASHTSPHHSPQHSSPHHSRTMPYSTARVMGVRAPSFSATHMSATPSPSSHSYSRI